LHSMARDKDGDLLAGVATDLLLFNNPERLLGSIFQRISTHTSVDLCLSYVVQDECLQSVFLGGLPLELHAPVKTLRFGEGVCGMAAQARTCLKVDCVSKTSDPAEAYLRNIGVDAFYCYPLLTGGKLLGTLSFGTRKKSHFASDEVEVQQAIADQVAVAFERMLLIRELAESNQRLLSINADLKRAHAELEQIAFSASHDLREPVRHLSIYAELLQRQLDSGVGEPASRYLQFVLSNAKRVELLVSDLLQYTGISQEEPAFEVADTRAVAERVSLKLRLLMEETHATLEFGDLPVIPMAQDDLAALLENLIENSIVHRRPGVPPSIQVFSQATKNGPAICIRDNGAGIEAEHQDTIFGLFRRLHSDPSGNRTGLGLTLCRKIVERYKGQIWVESEPGKGALFCFTFPEHAAPKVLAARSGRRA